LQISPRAGRLRIAFDLVMADDQVTAATTHSAQNPGKLTVASGSIKSLTPPWECEVANAEVAIGALNYSGSRRNAGSNLNLSAMLKTTSHLAWQSQGWQVTGQVITDQVN